MFQQKKFQKHPLKVLSVLLKLHEQTHADQQRNFPTENTIIYWTWISDLFIYLFIFDRPFWLVHLKQFINMFLSKSFVAMKTRLLRYFKIFIKFRIFQISL
jgi:hypothetical protein